MTLLREPILQPVALEDLGVAEPQEVTRPLELVTPPSEADLCLASLYGRFDDLVHVNKHGRAYRDHGKFLSNNELEQIAAHQDQIREGILQREAEARAHRQEVKMHAPYGALNLRDRRRTTQNVAVESAEKGHTETAKEAHSPLTPLGYAERVARESMQGQARVRYVSLPPKSSRVRERFDAVRWWWEGIEPFDKVTTVVTLGAVAVMAGVYLRTSPPSTDEFVQSARSPGAAAHVLAPSRPDVAPPARSDRPVASPTEIRIPNHLTPLHPKGDSIWHEVETLQTQGHHLSRAQTLEVTAQIMHDNHIATEEQAEHLSVGFKAKLSKKARSMLQRFFHTKVAAVS